MKLLHHPGDLETEGRRICVAIGMFDGIHLGHQQVIEQTQADARQHAGLSLVLTFEEHPNVVVAPAHAPPMIYPLAKKLEVLEQLGVDAALLIKFDRDFSERPAEAFIHSLTQTWPRLYSIAVGSNFTFGHRRSGNLDLLNRLGQKLRFVVHGLTPVSLGGKTISSTRIRAAIQEGQFDLVHQMLGRPYALAGRVVRGDQLGRQLGFPTANLNVAGLAVPPLGVYAGQAKVGRQWLPCVVNIGYRPTLDRSHRPLRVEAHLLDFEASLYDEWVELLFLNRLRDERAFASLDELKYQIQRDIQAARDLI
jgi:riboflavin kinase / FMN adenylyltransferase